MTTPRKISERDKIDPTTITTWCEEQNGQMESSEVIDIPGDAWMEEHILQAVMTMVSDQ